MIIYAFIEGVFKPLRDEVNMTGTRVMPPSSVRTVTENWTVIKAMLAFVEAVPNISQGPTKPSDNNISLNYPSSHFYHKNSHNQPVQNKIVHRDIIYTF